MGRVLTYFAAMMCGIATIASTAVHPSPAFAERTAGARLLDFVLTPSLD
jgi:hypothetical protein